MNHERDLYGLLQRVRRRWAGAAMLAAIGRASAAAAILLLAAAGLDWWMELRDASLIALGFAVAIAAGAFAGRAVWLLRRRPSDRQVARFIEERCPELEDRLVSATALAGRDAPGSLRALLLADAARCAKAIDSSRIVSAGSLGRAGGLAAGGLALLLAGGIVAWAPAVRVADAARLRWFPGTLSLVVEPGNARVAAGAPFEIRARLVGTSSAVGATRPVVLLGSQDGSAVSAMTPRGDAFALELSAVERSFTYRVRAGRAESAEYSVTALVPARVERIDVDYEYPSFTGLEPRREEDGGDIFAPAGTRVRLRVSADKPVRQGALVLADGRRLDLATDSTGALEGAFEIVEDGSYRVALLDVDGLESPGDIEYFIRIMNDRPPDVRIVRPAGDRSVTPLEEVTIEARADDDYGVASLELVYSVRGSAERRVPLGGGPTATSRAGSHLLYLEDLAVEPGDFISYYARARDVGRGKRPTESRSDIYFLEVRPFDAEFEAAASQAGAGGTSASIENLVRAQKDIISATWKLDRRSQAGRSEADIRAVGRAQAELKSQAQAAAVAAHYGLGRGGRRGDDETGEPLAAAVEAMERAQAELEAIRPTTALPPEMDALNQLLRAQAAIRRRQVSRQQANGAGSGTSRQERDLSSLFDRELQRQQETNYETRPPAQSGEQKTETEALGEIQDLARRQNELSRQQRDLSQASLDPQELQRQLERLTREQNELRQRAEELSRQIDRQARQASGSQAPGTAGGGDPDQGGASAGAQAGQERAVREAADEMRGAASDLRRRDLDAASARSARAAATLRDLEERLRGGRPDAERRALRELQMEARQLADDEARLASDARSLEPAGASGRPDGIRRLAGEQDRLADRTERFERAARSLASAGAARKRSVGEALTAIEREAISRRMRDAAGAWRDSTTGAGQPQNARADAPAETGQQLADELGRMAATLADAMGPAGAPEARELADRLADLRASRERLDALARELARARQGGSDGANRGAANEPGGRSGNERAAIRDPARIQADLARELEHAQQLVDAAGATGNGRGTGTTPETPRFTMGAPGTEAFKQDFSRWTSLMREADLALEGSEQALSEQLAARLVADRLNAGAHHDVPEAYRSLVAKYYEALARKKR